ncbi:MAG: hypothetical protein K5656_06760 [Lachnospiraceae bacterium]|nr:hypothetical protein [Lachnospiraceae bacterium]
MIETITLKLMHILRRSLKRSVIMDQYWHNQALWAKRENKGYIDRQSEFSSYKYGYANAYFRGHFFNGQYLNASMNSCEVIAVYNALLALNNMTEKYSFPKLLKQFSYKGMVLKGVFGTSPLSSIEFLKNEGYKVKSLVGKKINRESVMALSDKYKTFIFVTFNNGCNPFSQVHTMSVTKKGFNFNTHNDYEGNKSYTSLYEAMISYNKGKGHPIMVIGIR